MKISTSILSMEDRNNIKKLENTSCDYIHLDVMDGSFVSNVVDFISDKDKILEIKKPVDIHLMVNNVSEYIDAYKIFNPTYITFHLEANCNIDQMIDKIKSICKVGISINPNTSIDKVIPYLDKVDLILIMSVEAGLGGQAFIESVVTKIEYLKQLQKDYHYEIEVDGGINNETILKVKDADIAVVGSYIVKQEDYEKQIRSLF